MTHTAARFRINPIQPLLALAAALIGAVAASAAPPDGHIAFVRGDSVSNAQVAVLNLATGQWSPIGPGDADGPPVWSPDGRHLTFSSGWRDGQRALIAVSLKSGESTTIPSPSAWNEYPRWSSDSRKVAFNGSDTPGEDFLYVYDTQDGGVTRWGGGRAGLMRPIWLEGRILLGFLAVAQALDWSDADVDLGAFAFDAGGRGMLLAIAMNPGTDAMSTELVLVTSRYVLPVPRSVMPSLGAYVEWAAEVSPDGRLLAFESNDGGDREIFVLSFSKGAFDVSNHREADWSPVWAPNSRSIAFESFRNGRRGIYKVFPDTIRVMPLAVSDNADNWAPAWSPDSQWVAFVSDRTGNPQLFLRDMQGEQTRALTSDASISAWAPAWQPEPAR